MPPAIPDKIPCESVQQFEQELVSLREALSFEETEETWDRIARAVTRFAAVVKGGGYKFERELINGVRFSIKPIVSAMNSERTRLSAAVLECVSIIAPRIGLEFDALVPLLIPHILRLATRTNKVYVTRSQATLGLILSFCHLPSIIRYLLVACKESKIVTGRAVALEGVLRCLNKWNWTQRDIKTKVGDVEEVIRITGRDKDAGIRQTSRKVFEAYKILFPERVEEFTGPLTPVMRKYLDIKPLSHGQNPMERVRQQSAAEKPHRPQSNPDFATSTSSLPSSTNAEVHTAPGAHVRSASSNAVIGTSSSGRSNSNPSSDIDSRSMPPPATIPTHARNASSSQARSAIDSQQGGTRYERQRVISTASSTYSTKSAPPDSHSGRERHPPVRLVTSQTNSSRENPVVAGSSGKARRVRKEAPVEPHPANRPDSTTITHKPPVRPMHPPNTNGLGTLKAKGPAREAIGVVRGVPQNATGIAFPTSESARTASTERKGAQRVPKPVLAPTPALVTPPKLERPATVMGNISRREAKPSIFRRGALGAPAVGAKQPEKKQEGFVPRRGGGVTQPTLSQLSKQRAPVSVNGAASHVPKSRAPTASNRPAWGAGVVKTDTARGMPASRGRGRGVATRAHTPKPSDKYKILPAMVPLPASPGREKEAVPQLTPLPTSLKAEKQAQYKEQTTEVLDTNLGTAVGAPEAEVEARVVLDEVVAVSEDVTTAAEVADGPHGHEQQEVDARTEKPSDAVRDDIPSNLDATVVQAPSPPRTPPFPSTDGESEDDELEDIEFTSGDAYAPGGAPIKTPRKLVNLDTTNVPERSPLGEVVLNA